MGLPRICLVRQSFPDRGLKDIPGETREQLELTDLASAVKPGARVAVGAGSRGITKIDVIVRAVVDYWKEHGAQPFIFPAMGTHGGANAEGQASVLAHYGIDENTMGCPVVSSLDVVSLGKTQEGIETFVDRHAFESDGIFLVNRIKWHTDFEGPIESGLCKMAAIGLGKFAGARQYHAFGHRIGLDVVIDSVCRRVIQSGKLLGGLAILEDAYHQPAQVAALRADRLLEQEARLLETVKSWAGRIPGKQIDLLIVDKMGKNISGTGMDTKTINRSMHGAANCYPTAPVIDRVFAREMDPLSYGNAIGVGLADVVTDRLVAQIDWDATFINCLTACTPRGIKLPVHFPTDRECIARIGPTAGRLHLEDLTVVWISNTNELAWLAVSENLLPDLTQEPALEIVSDPFDLPFGSDDNLPLLKDVFAESGVQVGDAFAK